MTKRWDRRFKQWNKVSITSTSGNAPVPDSGDLEAVTCDLSLGGVKLYSPTPLPTGAVVTGRIDFVRSHQSLCFEAEVRWLRKSETEEIWEIGMRFIHKTPQALTLLMNNLYNRSVDFTPSRSRK